LAPNEHCFLHQKFTASVEGRGASGRAGKKLAAIL
jgi:hypothetical protein